MFGVEREEGKGGRRRRGVRGSCSIRRDDDPTALRFVFFLFESRVVERKFCKGDGETKKEIREGRNPFDQRASKTRPAPAPINIANPTPPPLSTLFAPAPVAPPVELAPALADAVEVPPALLLELPPVERVELPLPLVAPAPTTLPSLVVCVTIVFESAVITVGI